ncbi:MAG: methyl-accepting chemotaxis protein [Oscillospiraceae bacterium]|nr:methyl-accepting chemotaxis protein [Oscillospiraceae bacterium]
MKNLKVSVKLIVSFVIVILLALVIGIVGIFGMMQINDGGTTMYREQTVPLVDLAYAREYFQRLRVQLRNAIIASGDLESLSAITSDVENREETFIYHMELYYPTLTEAGRVIYNDMMDSFREYQEGMQYILAGARAGEDGDYLFEYMIERVAGPADNVADLTGTLMDMRVVQAGENNSDNDDLFQLMLIVIIVVIIVAVIIAITLALYISGLISKPLQVLTKFMKRASTTGDIVVRKDEQEAIAKYRLIKDEVGQCIDATSAFISEINHEMDQLEKVAEGDLTIKVNLLSEDDKIGKSLKRTVDGLREIFGEINESTAQVSDGAKQVSEGAQSLAQGSTEQAASVEELSATITDIEKKTRENADMAGKAADLANEIKGSAEKGSGQMDEMVTAVNDINQASQNISKVIKVIDDIAFQTNILALNAAVEAARAGQHGKGFAVVAEEVRNLAAKSAEAAKDTGGLISNSIEKAELGAKIAQDTAESLTEIVTGINESSQLVGDISASSNEQSEAISQINSSLDQVSNVIQQTSATAEESAAASEEMSSQSETLKGLVERFRL